MHLNPDRDSDGNPIVVDMSPLEDAARQVIARKYGGQAALEARFERLLGRILGLYAFPLKRPERFESTLRMPGPVVETSGTLIAEDRVRWTFEAMEAFPFGYEMSARALAPDRALQTKLLRAEPLASRAALVEYVALVSADDRLLQAMRDCAAQESLAPLDRLRDAVAEDGSAAGSAARARIQRLSTLLGVRAGGSR